MCRVDKTNKIKVNIDGDSPDEGLLLFQVFTKVNDLEFKFGDVLILGTGNGVGSFAVGR